MATILVPSGPDTQINTDNGGGNGVTGAQQFPQITRLADGRFAIVYQSPSFGNAADSDIIAAIVNPDGSLSSRSFLDVFTVAGQQTAPALAARTDGGFGVVFTNERHADGTVDPNGTNISYRTVSAAGALGATPLAIADLNGGAGQDALQNAAVATLASGRQIVVFERVVSGTDRDVFLNVVNAAGTATEFSAASPLAVANTNRNEILPAVAANGENALIVYSEGDPDQVSIGVRLYIRVFNGQTNTLGPRLEAINPIAGGDNLFNPAVIALDGDRYAVVFQHQGGRLFSAIYDPAVLGPGGSPFSQTATVTDHGSNASLARTPDGGFIVSWTESNGTDLDVRARVFTAAGQAVGAAPLTLGTMTDAAQDFSFVATNADHAFFAWQDGGVRPIDGSPSGVRGMSFQMVSTPANSDFNGDGVDDVLWRHANGQVVEWLMANGQVGSNFGVGPLDVAWHFQDSGDLNADGRADILWRHDNGQVLLWQMNGAQIAANTTIATVSNDYHVQGIGDFNADNRGDVLWRHDSGQVVLWQMNGAQIVANTAIANVSNQYHVQGIDDFGGDGRVDALWRHDSGQVVLWQMNGDQIVGNTAIANVSTQYHIQGVGDFNLDGHADILWRHDSGQVVLWRMNGDQIVANTAIANVSNQYHVQDVGDFNSDGRADVLWRHDNGQVVLWQMNGDQIVSNTALATVGNEYTIQAHHFDLV